MNLQEAASKIQSPNSRDRLLALASLRNATNEEAAPLILQLIQDDNLQIRSMAVFALGIKPNPQSLPTLVHILQTEPDYGIRADAAGALGYLQDPRAFTPSSTPFTKT